MKSISGRLLAWLLGAVLAAALVQGYWTYRVALEGAEQLFDYQIWQLALALQDRPGDPLDLVREPLDAELDFVVHIWSSEGERIYQSHAHFSLPEQTPIGYSSVKTPAGEWRVYGTQSRDRVIQVAQPIQVRRKLAAEMALRALAPLAGLAVVLAIAVFVTVRGIVRPLRQVAAQASARGVGTVTPLTETHLPTEIAPLVQSFNQLLGRLDAVIESQRHFVADAAHELRSPITALKVQLQLLMRAQDPTEQGRLANQLAGGIERASHLVNQLLTLARADAVPLDSDASAVRLDEVARQAVADASTLAQSQGVDLGLAEAEAAEVNGSADGLRVLARNLIDNAVRYTPRGGRVDVAVRKEATNLAVLDVADSGPGIPAEDRDRIFDRFYRRSEAAATGSGLGLAIVRSIADRHGGRVSLHDSSLGGLLVRAELPRCSPRSANT